MSRRIILDCDPGVDDAWALVFALGDPGLQVCGVTTVGGNVDLEATTANALRICAFAHADEVPVVAGSAVPLRGEPVAAATGGDIGGGVHGPGGLGRARLPEPAKGPRDGHAVDFILDTVTASPGEITLVAIGPLTNVARALQRSPRLAERVRDVVIMGGSAGVGNATPYAEYNIAADPEAAAVVFAAVPTVTMVGLDMTLRVRAGMEVLHPLQCMGKLADDLLLPALDGYRDGQGPGDGRPMHDLCATVLVAAPELFDRRPAQVQVMTSGPRAGMTVVDFGAQAGARNASVVVGIETDALWGRALASYGRLATTLAQPSGSP